MNLSCRRKGFDYVRKVNEGLSEFACDERPNDLCLSNVYEARDVLSVVVIFLTHFD